MSKVIKIPYDQMIIGLDKLFFSDGDPEEKDKIILSYLESTGYTWDDILNHQDINLN